jgi:hypothetical protein
METERSRLTAAVVGRGFERPRRGRLGLVAGLAAAMVVAACALVGAPALAQQQKKRITLDELVIEGNIQKPEAFFILPRTNLNFNELQRREDLKRKIIETVRREPL